jgi:hypothetical protein
MVSAEAAVVIMAYMSAAPKTMQMTARNRTLFLAERRAKRSLYSAKPIKYSDEIIVVTAFLDVSHNSLLKN